MWDFWWTKWYWDRFFPKCFGFSGAGFLGKAKKQQGCTISLKAAVCP
jgi:hypothetical protein